VTDNDGITYFSHTTSKTAVNRTHYAPPQEKTSKLTCSKI